MDRIWFKRRRPVEFCRSYRPVEVGNWKSRRRVGWNRSIDTVVLYDGYPAVRADFLMQDKTVPEILTGAIPVRTHAKHLSLAIARLFNHDLLVNQDQQDAAHKRWPAIAAFLIHEELIENFSPHERAAKRLKSAVQWLGTIAVALTLAALLGSAIELRQQSQSVVVVTPRLTNQATEQAPTQILFEISGISGLILAVLASRYGPFRRRWLKHRLLTEIFRQWHFRRLLNEPNWASLHLAKKERDAAFLGLTQSLSGSLGQKMDLLIKSGDDPNGEIPDAILPADADLQAQLLDAYRILRLDHQLEYMVWKDSPEDKTFLGLSSESLVWMSDLLAGITLLAALACSIVTLFWSLEWAPFAAVSLAIVGVAVRAWRDGFALGEDKERYRETRHRLELVRTRWLSAPTGEERFNLAREIEQITLEEMRSFVHGHEKAQFLF